MNGKTDVFPGLILPQAVSRSGVCTAWRMRMGNSEEYLMSTEQKKGHVISRNSAVSAV